MNILKSLTVAGPLFFALPAKPLYLYAKDEKPGDINGNNINDVWHIIVE